MAPSAPLTGRTLRPPTATTPDFRVLTSVTEADRDEIATVHPSPSLSHPLRTLGPWPRSEPSTAAPSAAPVRPAGPAAAPAAASGTRSSRSSNPSAARRRRLRCGTHPAARTRPDPRGRRRRVRGPPHRHRRARPGARRRPRPRQRHPRRRRAGHRQVHPPPPDARLPRRPPAPRPAGERRGEHPAGPAPGRAARPLDPRILVLGETELHEHRRRRRAHANPTCSSSTRSRPSSIPPSSRRPGRVAQVRECAHQLVQLAKQRAMSTVLVGHVTKDGALAGPRVLEHVVDTVLAFEGDRHHALRLLRAPRSTASAPPRSWACSR